MTLLFSSVLLSLGWFTVVNAAASLVAWRLAGRGGLSRRSARSLLILRLLPCSTALLVAGVLFAPAHLQLEPRESGETFGMVLYAAAFVALALVGLSARRMVAVVRAEWRLRAALRGQIGIRCANGTRAWEVSWLRGISLAGILRPSVLVGRAARLALTPAELDVALAHELAHRRAHDNAKRFAMRCAPDLFGWTAVARQLERAWTAAAERDADATAAAGDDERASALASALVKIARLGGEARGATTPAWSTFHESGLLESRVRRLVGSAQAPVQQKGLGVAFAAIPVLAAVAWLVGVPATLHRLTDYAIQILP